MPIPATPVLQSQASCSLPGLRGASVAIIAPASKRKLLMYNRPTRYEQQLEAPLLSLTAAEEVLDESPSGSVIFFVHSDPCHQGRGGSGGGGLGSSSLGSRSRHQLYISFKYRTSKFHYAYYWVSLKAMHREARRTIFHVEQRHYEIVHELFTVFIPSLRTWLGAIVKAANFIDQPVESVDLRSALRVRHHLVLTRRTSAIASVVLCKLDPETKKILSTGIVFDFKTRRVRDDAGNPLRSFHEVFQMFCLGLHPGNPLLPSPREDEEPLAPSLLEGLEAEASPKSKLRKLLRLQHIVRQEQSREGEEQLLELVTTFLLPQLMDNAVRVSSAASLPLGGPATGGGVVEATGSISGNASVAAATEASTAASASAEQLAGRGIGDFALEAPFNEMQVLICDILAELCDLRVEAVGPHVWRMCKGYLEDTTNWHACLAALELLTLMSERLAKWLVERTDAVSRLFGLFVEVQQLLVIQRESIMAAPVARTPQLPPRMGQSRGESGSSSTSRLPTFSASSPLPGDHSRHRSGGSAFSPSLSHAGEAMMRESGHSGRCWGEPLLGRDRSRGGLGTSQQSPPPPALSGGGGSSASHARMGAAGVRRAPSFDSFEEMGQPGRADGRGASAPGGSASPTRRSGDDGGAVRRWCGEPSGALADASGGIFGAASGREAAAGESRQPRPVRVPPLNLNLAARGPSAGGGFASALPQESTPSMTRSSRRLRHRAMRELPPPPATAGSTGAGFGTSSRSSGSSRLAPSLSAPVLPGLRFAATSSFAAPTPHSPPNSAGTMTTGSQLSTPGEQRQSFTQADELARALGEACLLADLSHLLKYKQEQQVQEAVMQTYPGFCSPHKPSSATVTPRSGVTTSAGPSLARAAPGSPQTDSAASLRSAARPLIPGSVPPPAGLGTMVASSSSASITTASAGGVIFASGGCSLSTAAPLSASSCSSSSSAHGDVRGGKPPAFRQARLHACLVLEHFCACACKPSAAIGPYVPANKLFEMLTGSCSRAGGSSFAVDWDGDVGEEVLHAVAVGGDEAAPADAARPPAPSPQPRAGSAGAGASRGRGLLQQRLSTVRLRRLSLLHDRLRRNAAARRCVCGAALAARSNGAAVISHVEDLWCTCIDDVLASCMWQFLRAHALHVEDMQTFNRVPAPSFDLQGVEALPAVSSPKNWDGLPNWWHIRLGLNLFLKRMSRELVQVFMQLRGAQRNTVSSGELVASYQQRLAILLRLCSAYLHHCCSRAMPLQVFHVLNPVLCAIKSYLCGIVEAGGAPPLPAPGLRLWVAYLQLVGAFVVRVRDVGAQCPKFGEVLLVQLLDFSPATTLASVPPDVATEDGAANRGGRAPEPAGVTAVTPAHASGTPTPTGGAVPRSPAFSPSAGRASGGGRGVARGGIGRSVSQRALHGPPRLPSAAMSGAVSSPRTTTASERSPVAKTPPAASRSIAAPGATPANSAANSIAATTAAPASGVCDHLPRILERALLDGGLDEALASGKQRPSGSAEDSAEALRCRALGFLEALLHFAQAIGSEVTVSRYGQSGGSAPRDGDVSGDNEMERRLHRSLQLASQPGLGALRPHESLKLSLDAAAEPLLRGLLGWLQFFFMPPSGLLCRLARKLPLAGGGPMAHRLVLCERALFRAPLVSESSYVSEAQAVDYYVRRHFLAFVRLYNSRKNQPHPVATAATTRSPLTQLCCLHLQTLLAIASLRTEAELPRRAFHQLSVLDFLAGEVDLEHETREMRDRFLRVAQGQAASPSPPLVLRGLPALGSMVRVSSPMSVATPTASPPLTAGSSPKLVGLASPGAGRGGMSSRGTLPGGGGGGNSLGAPPVNKAVPRLQLGGLRPSLQGCSGLGAPPPEEPLPPAAMGTPLAAPPPPPALAAPPPPTEPLALVPPLAGNGATASSSALAADPPRRSLPVVPRLLIGANAPALGAATAGSPEAATADALSSTSGDAVTTASTGLLGTGGTSVAAPLAAAATELDAGGGELSPDSGKAGGGAPGQRLAGWRVGMSLGLGSPLDPELPAAAPLAPPPPSDSDSDSSSDAGPAPLSLSPPRPPEVREGSGVGAGGLVPAVAMMPMAAQVAAPAPMPTFSASPPLLQQAAPPVPPLAPPTAAPPVAAPATFSDDSSDEDEEEQQGESASGPEHSGAGGASTAALPPLPSLSLSQSEPLVAAGGLLLQLQRPSQPCSVPKLSFSGLRPSLQGCTGLGAPPPEEPVAKPPDPALQLHRPLPATVDAVASSAPRPPPIVTQASHSQPPLAPMLSPTVPDRSEPWGGSGCQSPLAGSSVSAAAAVEADLCSMGVVNQNIVYFEGRQRRTIYEDLELHSLMLTLIFALLLTPKRGLLDPRYVDQYPLLNHKRNVPFLLGLHLNHSANRAVLPWLAQQLESISHLGAFRLLKLLCETAMHRWLYTNWTRIAGGMFGTVYRCAVQVGEPNLVAVKQIPKQTSIQDRCVFTDVFSEIICLDVIRFEEHVCQLFDYGVDETGYWIVMKYYPTTLKKWREALLGSVEDNLPALLEVYRQVLKAVHVLHRHGIIHYDLKCDNVMLDPDRALHGDVAGVGISAGGANSRAATVGTPLAPSRAASTGTSRDGSEESEGSKERRVGGVVECPSPGARQRERSSSAVWPPVKEEEPMLPGLDTGRAALNRSLSLGRALRDEQIPCIAVADFGESWMMAATDELCMKSRGTELVKCPEMIAEKGRNKEAHHHDRRKRVGTNQSADVWSLGCLFFELITGRFLFQDENFGEFWARVTGLGQERLEVVSEANIRLFEGNMPLLEFLRFMLVREPERRPSIASVIKKFELYAAEAIKPSTSTSSLGDEELDRSLPAIMQRLDSTASIDSPHSVACSTGGSSAGGALSRSDGSRPERPLICAGGEADSSFTKVFHDLCVLEASDEVVNADGAVLLGHGSGAGLLKPVLEEHVWTHIVDFRITGAVRRSDSPPGGASGSDMQHGFLPRECVKGAHCLLQLPWSSTTRSAEDLVAFLPTIFDFLRHAAISGGEVLFIDGCSTDARGGAAAPPAKDDNAAKADGAAEQHGATPTLAGVSKAPPITPPSSAGGGSAALVAGGGPVGSGGTAGRGGLAMAAILALTTEVFRMAVFPAFSYLNSQFLIPAIRPDVVAALSRFQETERRPAWRRMESAVRVACLCGSCSWHIPTAWLAASTPHLRQAVGDEAASSPLPGPNARLVSCACNAKNCMGSCCPTRGHCESYTRWLRARFGVTESQLRWLWLPEGVDARDYADGGANGVLARGLQQQAEPVSEGGRARQDDHAASRSQRFRCRSCQVLTHAEVRQAGSHPSQPPRVAVVCTYEGLRWRVACEKTVSQSEAVVPGSGPFEGGPMGPQGPAQASSASRPPPLSLPGATAPAAAAPTLEAAWAASMASGCRRPPPHLHQARLAEVVLPDVQLSAQYLI